LRLLQQRLLEELCEDEGHGARHLEADGDVADGLEVAGAVALVFAEFLEQALLEEPR